MSDVSAERVEWLWPGRLPRGKMVVLDGDPSCGKSTLCLDLAARVSAGKPWPDGQSQGDPGAVLILSAEDGLKDTLRPRLEAAGADASRVHALVDVPVYSDERVRSVPPSIPRDLPTIERIITSRGVSLVVVDVLMAYLGAGVDSHRDQDVRGALHQIGAVAERTGACFVLIRHLNKAGGGSPLYRGGGSIGIIGAARAAFLVARDPDDTERRIFATTKMNIAPEPPSLAYRLVSNDEMGCAQLEWESGPVDLRAEQLLRGPRDDDEVQEQADAAGWLADWLGERGGEAGATDVKKAATAEGFAWDAVKRAKSRAGVRSAKIGGAGWVWRIARDTQDQGPKGAAREQESTLSEAAPLLPSCSLTQVGRSDTHTAGCTCADCVVEEAL